MGETGRAIPPGIGRRARGRFEMASRGLSIAPLFIFEPRAQAMHRDAWMRGGERLELLAGAAPELGVEGGFRDQPSATGMIGIERGKPLKAGEALKRFGRWRGGQIKPAQNGVRLMAEAGFDRARGATAFAKRKSRLGRQNPGGQKGGVGAERAFGLLERLARITARTRRRGLLIKQARATAGRRIGLDGAVPAGTLDQGAGAVLIANAAAQFQ